MPKNTKWAALGSNITNKIDAFRSSPAALMYFVSIIIVAGGVGWWLPIVKGEGANLKDFMTYIFALLSAISADYLIRKNGDKPEDALLKDIDFSMFVGAIIFLSVSCVTISINVENIFVGWGFMVFSVTLLWLLWWTLLEERKFDVSMKTIGAATIGVQTPNPARKETSSLAAFKEKNKGNKNG